MPSAMEKGTAMLHTFRTIMLQNGLAVLQHDSQSVAQLPIKASHMMSDTTTLKCSASAD
jgi:hypothetical protein